MTTLAGTMVSVNVKPSRPLQEQRSKMSSFEKSCTYCGQKIKLSDSTGRWLPYNLDKAAHECRDKSSSFSRKQPQTTEKNLAENKKPIVTVEQCPERLNEIERKVS